MRPRKQILIWSENEQQSSELAFILKTQLQVRVEKTTAYTFAAALQAMSDLSLIIFVDNGNRRLMASLGELAGSLDGVPLLVVQKTRLPLRSFVATSVVGLDVPHSELLEYVRILLVRKTGPKRGPLTAKVVREIKTMQAEGRSISNICLYLHIGKLTVYKALHTPDPLPVVREEMDGEAMTA